MQKEFLPYQPITQEHHDEIALSFLYDFYRNLVTTREDSYFGMQRFQDAYSRLSSHDKKGDKGKTIEGQVEAERTRLAMTEFSLKCVLKRIRSIDPKAPVFEVAPIVLE